MMLMQKGRARMKIEGSYAIGYRTRDRKETHISGPVYVQLFDSTGAVETEAWSKRAVYQERRSEFELYDSITVQTNTDRYLYSDYLMWSQKNRQYLITPFCHDHHPYRQYYRKRILRINRPLGVHHSRTGRPIQTRMIYRVTYHLRSVLLFLMVMWVCACIPQTAQSQNNVNIIEAGVLQTSFHQWADRNENPG